MGLLGFFRKIQGLLVSVLALSVTLGCAPDATQDVASKSYGLEIAILSGNNQIGEVDKLVAEPFVVIVTAPDGSTVQDVQVNFFELTNSGVLITSPNVVTNKNGLAQTNVRTPSSFDSSARVRACIATSGECVDFDLASDEANENQRFEITSTNDNVEVAGQGFGFQVVVKPIGSDSINESYNETVDLEWTFITQASWGQVFPTVLPGVYTCTFTAGVCDIPVSVTLTDARQDTVIFMGDGNDGLVDVFAHRIEVLPDTPTQVVITTSLGGPDAGAQVITDNQLFTTDDPDFTFFTAITDAVGNYVEDPATVSFSASHAQIGDYLSVINGISTALSFERTLPHPSGGYLYANVPGYPQAQSPLLTIDPGNPVSINVVFSGSAPAGIGIDFDLEVVDADGNRVGQQFSGPGVQGFYPIEYTFSNYVSPPNPSAGSIPYFDNHNYYGETVTLPQQFTGGFANSNDENLIFFDATGVTPEMDLRLITEGTDFAAFTVTGSESFSVTLSGGRYINFRNASGDAGDSLCHARFFTYSSGYLYNYYELRTTINDILGSNLNNGSRPECQGLSVLAGSGDITIFASLEDDGGNFVQNILGVFEVETAELGRSDFLGQIGPVSVTTGSVVLTPTLSTDGGPSSRWINFIPQTGSVTLHQNFLGDIDAGDVVDYELRIVRGNSPLGYDEAATDEVVDLAVVPIDALGNQVTQYWATRPVTISLSSFPSASPRGTPPVFPSAGTITITFGNPMPIAGRNVSGPGSEYLFTGLRTGLAGETILINITDVNDPARSDTLEWKVRPSRGMSMDLYQDNDFASGGISITNQNLTYTTDEFHQIYAQVFDAERNPIDVLSTSIDWDEPVVFPIDGSTIRDIVSPATNIRFEGDRPASGVLRATYEYAYGTGIVTISAQTGTLDVVPGEPHGIWIDLGVGQHTVTAGTPFSAGVVIQDRKNNQATQINGAVTLNIGVINKGATTPYGHTQTQPPDGVYTFTNGRHNFTGTPFTFFSADNDGSYEIIVSTGDFSTAPDNVSGKTPVFEVLHQPFDHLYAYGQDTTVGTSGQLRIEARDLYGNLTTDEPYASKTISFQINSNLGDEDLTNVSGMVSLSIGDFSLPNQKVLTGNLDNGTGNLYIRSTKSGDVTYDIYTLSVTGTNNLNDLTFLPNPTISGFRWAPGFEPKSVNSTINPLFPFKVEILDLYDNRIDTNFWNTVELSLSGNVGSLGNYAPPYTMNQGLVEFANLSYTVQDTFTITAYLTSDPATFNDSAVVSTQLGSESRTVVVLPGQQFNEGAATITAAVTGAPFGGPAQVNVGTTFTVSLHMADDSFNTKTTYTAPSSLVSSDPNMQITDTSGGFVSGIATFDVTPRRQGVHTIAGGVSGVVNHESFSFTVVPGVADRLVVIPPGQSLNEGALTLGDALADVAVTQTAGSVFPVTIAATDSYYNKISTYSHGGITLTINNDALAPPLPTVAMSGGEAVFNVTLLKAATNHNLTADNAVAPALTDTTSEDFSVVGGSATQYIAVYDGQTHFTGRPIGDYAGAVQGSPNTITTDTTLNVAVKAVDNYFNTDPNHSGTVNVATVDDPTDTDPGSGSFTNGVRNIVLSPVTAGANQTISITGTGLTTNIPADYDVNPGVAANLVVLFNDYQTLQQGQTSLANAISDSSELTVAAGVTVPVRVYATDAEFNIRDDDSTTVSLTPSVANHRILPGATQTFTNGIANFTLETFLVGAGYGIAPSASGYGSPNNSVNYNITLSSGNRLLAILPGQSFSPGHINSDDAAVGTPFDQTQGSGFPFQVTIIATDQFFNQRTAASDSVTLNGTGTSVTSTNPIALTGGDAVYTLHYTSSGTNRTVNGTAGGYSPVTSKQFDVNAVLNDPVLDLSDPTTSDTTYIRQRTVSTAITSDSTAVRWCLTETAGRPSTGTNQRSACPSGQGPDSGWHTSDPGTYTVSTGDGSKTVYVWTADSANNVNLNPSTDSITLDTDLPNNPTGLALDNPNDPGTGYSNVLTVSLDVTLDGDTVEYCVIEVPNGTPVGPPAYNNGCWTAVPGSFPINYNFVSGQGNKDIWVFAKDVAENVSAGGDKYDIVYDTTNPSFPGGPDITGVLGNDDDVADNLLGSTGDPTVQFQAASDTYLKEYVVAIYDGGSLACGAPVTTGSTSYTFSGCGLTDTNSYTVSLMARDHAGNETLADNSGFSFTVDLVAPGAFTITGMTGGTGDTDSDVWLTDGLNDPETTWVDASGEDYYGVEILNGADTTVCAEVTIAAGSTSFDGFSGCNLADQTLYKAKVIAYDNARNKTEATNSPFVFETTEGIFDFDVVVNTAGNITAGADFTVSLIARRKNDEIATNYAGLKTITWSSNASNNINICGNPINPNVETPSTSVVFASGQAVSGNFKLKANETARNITATDSGASKTGTSSNFDVVADASACIRIEDAAGGGQTEVTSDSIAIDANIALYAAGYDTWGNYTGLENVTWTGYGDAEFLPVPYASSGATTIVGTKTGTGSVSISGGASNESMSLTVGSGATTWNAGTTDLDGNNVLGSANIRAVHYWDVQADAVTAWRTAGTQSWYSESFSATRGGRSDFPTHALVVGTTSGLDIIDSKTNKLFMRFNAASNRAINSDLGSIQAISALNGKIYVAISDQSSVGGLVILDFVNDEIYESTNSVREKSDRNLSQRNLAGTYSSDTTYQILGDHRLYDLSSQRIGGVDYLAIAEGNGVEVMRTSGTTTIYGDATTGLVKTVALASDTMLYYSEENSGLHRKDLSLPLGANFTPDTTYDLSSSPQMPDLAFNDLEVIEGNSNADSGKHQVLLGTSKGLVIVDDHGTPASSDIKLYNITGTGYSGLSGTSGFVSTRSEYLNIPDGGAMSGVTDMTVELRFRATSDPTSTVLYQKGNPSSDGSFGLHFNGSGQLEFWVRHNSTTYSVQSTTNSWSGDNWYHATGVISGSSINLFLDGGEKDTDTSMNFASPVITLSSDAATLGGTSGGSHFNGYIDELRVSDIARYTGSSFTPSGPYSDDGNTLYLYHFNGNLNYSDTGAQQTATVGGGTPHFAYGLYSGTSDAVVALDGVKSGSSSRAMIATSSGWAEISNVDSGSASQDSYNSLSGINSLEVYHIDSINNFDSLTGRSSGGLRLSRE